MIEMCPYCGEDFALCDCLERYAGSSRYDDFDHGGYTCDTEWLVHDDPDCPFYEGDERQPTKGERRAARKHNNEKMVVTNRSVGDLARLAARPRKKGHRQ